MLEPEPDECPACDLKPHVPYSCDVCGEDGCTECVIDGECDECRAAFGQQIEDSEEEAT